MPDGKYGRDWMSQWCPSCKKIVDARLELTWAGCYLARDVSTCLSCGRVLWDHRTLTREQRAALPPYVHKEKKRVEQLTLF